MQPITVTINGMTFQLGQPLPGSITSLEVIIHPTPFGTSIPVEQARLLKSWLNDIIDRLDTPHVSFNNIIIPTNELVKF